MNPLLALIEHGQSYWLDNLTREMILDGTLAERVRHEGLRGVTSNPAIFEKAISQGDEYDADIARFADEGISVEAIYDRLTVADVRAACDVLRTVFDESDGVDGYVSLEVSPRLADDTDRTLDEARRLFRAVDRPNVHIKIPGTPAGVPAIEEAIFEGINVNVTLLFGIAAYSAISDAYVRGLERRVEAGRSAADVASVASFFLSRIDSLTDARLEALAAEADSDERRRRIEASLGRAAIANAKLAYERFSETLAGERWSALADGGARPQRMLWASTSTKNEAYPDVKYVEPLIGPETVNTLPESTIVAFRDHGRVATTVSEDLEGARVAMRDLADVGIDFDAVTDQLLEDGVEKFVIPFDRLLDTLASRRAEVTGGVATAGS